MSLLDFDRPPDRYAVMGNPISHSKSPLIHRLFAEQTGQRLEYTAIQVDVGGFAQAVGNFQASGGSGLNVTVPFKQEAWALADRRSERAESAGAVNTLCFESDGTIIGDNTDGIGLVRDLTVNLGQDIQGRTVLLLGAGGAVRGVLAPLLAERPARLIIANRNADKAVQLAEQFGRLGEIRGCGFEDIDTTDVDIIINGTAASLHGDLPAIDPALAAGADLCYDMMYGAEPTPFMSWCDRQGTKKTSDGLGMLVEQAAESFFLWRNTRPVTAEVIAAVRASLSASA